VDYEEKITCFIDILGFKNTIKETSKEEVRNRLYEVIHHLKPGAILNELYGSIPCYSLDRDNTVKPANQVFTGELREQFQNRYPLVITQFSDSFVISCPAENSASCKFLLEAVYRIHLMFFYSLGLMMRGGICMGSLVHEEGGALFGPSMNEAYDLESTLAIYPRVVFSNDAAIYLRELLKDSDEIIPLKKSFDGHDFIDIVSISSWPRCAKQEAQETKKQLLAIENDVLKSFPKAHPKIAYLLSQWELSNAAI
jgi:hypothetical protein